MARPNLRSIAGRPVSFEPHFYAELQKPLEVEPHKFNPEPWVAAVCLLLFAVALWVIAFQ